MRLSATERIIRESEEQDGAPENPSRGSGKIVAPLTATTTARDGTGPRGWPMAFEVDVDGLRIEDDEEEEKTQVNTEKVQAALKELRSFDPPPRRAPSNAGAGAPIAAPAPVDASLEQDPLSLLPEVEWVEPPPLLVGDSNPGGSFDLRPRHTVGRRGGVLIAAATTISVALLLGAWTARWGTPGIGGVKRGSSGVGGAATSPTAAPRASLSAVIVPTPREAPTAAAPTAEAPAAAAPTPEAPAREAPPAVAAAVSAPPIQVLAPAPGRPAAIAGEAAAADATSQAASPDSDESRQKQPSAKAGKSRPSRKATAHKAHRRKSHAAKAKGSHPRTNQAPGVANPPAVRAPASTPVAPRGNTDPDYTLPPTD